MSITISILSTKFSRGLFVHTNNFNLLAHIYRIYCNTIHHWDTMLLGQVTHVRHEDMVHNMPGVAWAVVRAAGLQWDKSVLKFHRKKYAVNTLLSMQVCQGVYNHSNDY